jgi:RNA polymerase sigma-70 factor (ECF subfamily)
LKRGSGQSILSLDAENTELRFRAEPVDEMSPEKAYDRRWARTLLDEVFKALETEWAAAGKAKIFALLKGSLTGEKNSQSYGELGHQLGLTEANVKVTVHRLRQRYRELLRLEIAKTVDSPEAVDDEIRHLFAAIQ